MRRITILAILLSLGGCATTHEIRDYDDEARRQADEALAEYIKEHRQIVFVEGGWQILAYCKGRTVAKAMKEQATLLCKPPKYPTEELAMSASVFVVSQRLTTRPDHPAAWIVRFDNLTEHDICLNAQWRLMDINAQDALSEWQVVPAGAKLQIGHMQQEVWDFGGKPVLLDYAGHVAGLLVRPVVEGGCYEVMEEKDE